MRPTLLLLICALALAAADDQGWRSELYADDWQPPGPTSDFRRDAFLQDYSYAGYAAGERALPGADDRQISVLDHGADPSGTSDSRAAIQAAIDAAATAGGATVVLPPGTYRISRAPQAKHCLRIAADGVVLRGAGADQTRLICTTPAMRGASMILFSGQRRHHGSTVALTAACTGPSTILPVGDVSGFQVGDLVEISWAFTDAWIAEQQQGPYWNDELGRPHPSRSIRRLTAVDAAAKTITIDIPTRYRLLPRDQAGVRVVDGFLRECGLADLSLGMASEAGTGYGERDWQTAGTAAWDCHGSWAVTFLHARHCWVSGIRSHAPADNPGGAHLLSNGIRLDRSQHCTITDCHLQRPLYGGGGGNGYLYRLVDSSDNLIRDCIAEHSRHGFVTSLAGTTGNVFLRCEDRVTGRQCGLSGSERTAGATSDNHMHFSHSNLFDSCRARQSAFTATHRWRMGSVPHGLTAALTVYWNTSGDQVPGGQVVLTAQGDRGYVIGTSGDSPGVGSASPAMLDPPDHIEGIGRGATLEPQSLYLDQLARRLQTAHGGQ